MAAGPGFDDDDGRPSQRRSPVIYRCSPLIILIFFHFLCRSLSYFTIFMLQASSFVFFSGEMTFPRPRAVSDVTAGIYSLEVRAAPYPEDQ